MVGPVGGIRSIFTYAVAGIRTATDNFAKHASAIAHQSVVDYLDRIQFSSAGPALAAQSQKQLGAQPLVEPSLASLQRIDPAQLREPAKIGVVRTQLGLVLDRQRR